MNTPPERSAPAWAPPEGGRPLPTLPDGRTPAAPRPAPDADDPTAGPDRAAPEEDGLVLGSRVDRYVVEKVLGEGGMARVYQVRHTILGTTHALKVVTLAGRSYRTRLLAEGRAQAGLHHPNIVAVTDVLELDEGIGLVLEYVPGGTLEALLHRRPLTLDQVDHLAAGLLRGVQYAHDAGLVHRDLKPANILLRTEGRFVTPKIADFGLVKSMALGDAGATRSGVAMGTPRYMAPEQIEDAKHVDHRADLFATGAILYAMLTGRHAFAPDSKGLLEIFRAVGIGDYAPVRELRPEAPDRMVEAITAALRTDPARRPASAAELRRLWFGRDVEEGVAWEPAELADPVTDGGAGQTLAPTPEAAERLPGTTVGSEGSADPARARLGTQTRLGATVVAASRRPSPLWALLAALPLGAGLLGAGLLVALGTYAWAPGVPAPTPEPAPAAPSAPAEASVPEASVPEAPVREVVVGPSPAPSRPRPAPAPAPAADPAPVAAPAPTAVPAPAPVAPAPPPAPVWSITQADRGYARCAGVDHGPGALPAGRCTFTAFFGDTPVTVARDVAVGPGDRVAVTCKPLFKLCDLAVAPGEAP